MNIFAIGLLALAVFYGTLIVSGSFGFRRVRTRIPVAGKHTPFVSVVIPARNEEAYIAACVRSVLANDYPDSRFEIVVVDDSSTDATSDVVAGLQLEFGPERLRLVSMAEDERGLRAHKKLALSAGIEASRGEIILTTDADCTVAPSWIRLMVDCFAPDTGLVAGPVLFRSDTSFFSRAQALEFMGLISLGAGLIGIGRPHLCNGANLAYRRASFDEVGGFAGLTDVTTGDDEMLLHRIAYDSAWNVVACIEPRAVVRTGTMPGLRDFIEQRKRWASAHARYPHRFLRLTSVLTYLFYATMAAGLTAALWTPSLMAPLGAALIIKIGSEAALLLPASRHFGEQSLAGLLLPLQLVQIPYILFIGAAGTFGRYAWKGRAVID